MLQTSQVGKLQCTVAKSTIEKHRSIGETHRIMTVLDSVIKFFCLDQPRVECLRQVTEVRLNSTVNVRSDSSVLPVHD